MVYCTSQKFGNNINDDKKFCLYVPETKRKSSIIVKCDIGCWLKIVDLIKDIVWGS